MSEAGPSEVTIARIQQQLILLLHAQGCLAATEDAASKCTVPHCKTFCAVLAHIEGCGDETGACSVEHCTSSRQIIAHWKSCESDDCALCIPPQAS